MDPSARPNNLISFPFERITWFCAQLEETGVENLDWDDSNVIPLWPYEPAQEDPALAAIEEDC